MQPTKMKVSDILTINERSLIAKSDFDRKGRAMKLPNMYQNRNWGNVLKTSPKTVTVKSSGADKKIYGRRTIISK